MQSRHHVFTHGQHSPSGFASSPPSQFEVDLAFEEKLEEETCWRTNLLIESEVKRVDERNQAF